MEDAGVLILVVVVEEGVEGVVLLATPTLMLAPLEREGVVGTDEDDVLLFLRGILTLRNYLSHQSPHHCYQRTTTTTSFRYY